MAVSSEDLPPFDLLRREASGHCLTLLKKVHGLKNRKATTTLFNPDN